MWWSDESCRSIIVDLLSSESMKQKLWIAEQIIAQEMYLQLLYLSVLSLFILNFMNFCQSFSIGEIPLLNLSSF